MKGPVKLTDKQKEALKVLTNEPRKASDLGFAAQTLLALVRAGLVGKTDESPAKYFLIDKTEVPAGATLMKTVDGKEFVFDFYGPDRRTTLNVRWNDLKGNPHSGRLLRARPEDGGAYIRERKAQGIVFVAWEDMVIMVEEEPTIGWKRDLYRKGVLAYDYDTL